MEYCLECKGWVHFPQVTGDWSATGGAGDPQPDNREFEVQVCQDDSSLSYRLAISTRTGIQMYA